MSNLHSIQFDLLEKMFQIHANVFSSKNFVRRADGSGILEPKLSLVEVAMFTVAATLPGHKILMMATLVKLCTAPPKEPTIGGPDTAIML